MTHYKLTDEEDQTHVHADGVFQPGDMALCGQDLMGDSHLGWGTAEPTGKRIDCPNCIRIIDHCKGISGHRIERGLIRP